MSRIRSVHPGLWTDDAFMALSSYARLLVIGLWNEAFDDGLFEWKTLTIKARIFPADNIDVAVLLDELIAGQFIRREEFDGRQVGLIRNFREFQRPKTPNSSGMMKPEWRIYVGLSDEIEEPLPNHSPNDGEKVPQMEDGGGKREEEEVEENISLDAERDFNDWYSAFPKHVGKGQARKAYRAARKKADVQALMAGAKAAAAQFATTDPQFIPHPATWLNGERWLDRPPARESWRDDPEMRGVL